LPLFSNNYISKENTASEKIIKFSSNNIRFVRVVLLHDGLILSNEPTCFLADVSLRAICRFKSFKEMLLETINVDGLSADKTNCPLTLASRELLQCCFDLETVNTDLLARHLNLAADSIASRFKRINKKLGTHSREEALIRAIRRGWIIASLPLIK
jgi:DNA-binding CsgD family transcriptional regulator